MSDWTICTLKEHYDQRFIDNSRAVDAALIAVKEESRKTELAAEKRFDLLNELRGGVATIEQLEALEKLVQSLDTRMSKNDGQSQGSQLTKVNVITYLTIAVSVLGLIVLIANGMIKGV